MFSVLILTLNEAHNLPACIGSLAGCDDIHVLDSGSTDTTAAVATSLGARFWQNPFQNFAQQRNYAHENLPFAYEWVFHLDADERMTPALATELRELAAAQRGPSRNLEGAWTAPKMLWKGRWVPHCTDYPAWQARFAHAPSFRFIEVGHGQRETPGHRLVYLKNNYLHDMSASGVEAWLDRHRRYALREAENWLAASRPLAADLRDFFGPDPLLRRRAFKRLSFRLPARPLLRFTYQYLLRGGFLDGISGLDYCLLLARYEGFISKEIRRLRQNRTPA